MPDFSMNYSDSSTGSEYLQRQTKAIADLIEYLDGQVRSVMGELEGNTANAYQEKHKEWQAKVNEMGHVLSLGNQNLIDITANYRTTDLNEGGRWESIRV